MIVLAQSIRAGAKGLSAATGSNVVRGDIRFNVSDDLVE
jgi:hypothetical protein